MSSNHSTCSSCCSDDVILETSVDRGLIIKVTIAAAFTLPLLLHMFLSTPILHNPIFQLLISIPVLTVGFLHFGKSAFSSIRRGHSNMDVLITIGFTSAFIYSVWGIIIGQPHDYLFFETSASIITYVLIGNLIEHRATKNTSSAIREFLTLAPQTAKRIRKAGISEIIEEIDANQISVGDKLLAATGDNIAADGLVIKSDGLVNESIITGESLAQEKQVNDKVFAGTIVEKGSLVFEVTACGKETLFSEILRTIQTAKNSKPTIQRLGDKVSEIFVPAVLGISILTFLITKFYFNLSLTQSLLRSIAVLVVACPCAMGLATPTAVMVAVGRAAKKGILIKGGDIFERLTKVTSVVFDKTGTLTEGKFAVQDIKLFTDLSIEEFKSIIKTLESYSSHPLALSLVDAFKDSASVEITQIKEEAGLMISGKMIDNKTVTFGSKKTLTSIKDNGKELTENYDLFLTIDNILVGALSLADIIRKDAKDLVRFLHANNIDTSILSGDTLRKCNLVAKEIEVSNVYSEQTPTQKLQIIKDLQKTDSVAYIGDGVNDVPSITAASVGISFAKASKSAVASAGAVILSDELKKVSETFRLAFITVSVIKQNLFWAFFYNVLMIPLAAFGFLSPSIAALAMGLSDVFVIGNSLRLKAISLNDKTD